MIKEFVAVSAWICPPVAFAALTAMLVLPAMLGDAMLGEEMLAVGAAGLPAAVGIPVRFSPAMAARKVAANLVASAFLR